MAKKGNKKKQAVSADGTITLATNSRARHDYKILDTVECGIVLVGTEIKSLRDGKISLNDAFATIDKGEVFLRNLHIPEYSYGHWTNHSPKRTRKLLLHRREIDRLLGQVRNGNRTLIPLKAYLKNGIAKLELGLGEGKQAYDKREDIKRRTEEREVTQMMGRRMKGMRG